MNFRDAAVSLLDTVAAVCDKVDRDPSEVTLVAVTKTFSVETINGFLEETKDILPLPNLGENKVQEILTKKPDLQGEYRLHLIGHLQSNKVKQVLPCIDCLHSLDSVKLADTLEKELSKINKRLPVFLQANPSREESKFGGGWEETRTLLDHALTLPHLEVIGLMTMAPLTEEEGVIRKCFRTLREWRDRLQEETGASLPELSMGMSHDYRIALEEGATQIRIGSALFGKRDIPHKK